MPLGKKPLVLSATDAAYLAGLIDGEGTIGLTRRHTGENRQLVLSIANTEAEILQWVLDRTGVGKITRKRISRAHHTPSHTYSVANRQALDILKQISPYLQSRKKQRAELALTEYVRLTPRNGRYSAETVVARRLFEARFLSIGSRASAIRIS